MQILWFYTIFSVITVSLISLIGALTLFVNLEQFKKYLSYLVSFAAGTLLGGAFLHIMPEIAESQGFTIFTSSQILIGLLIFFALEKIICWRHCHIPTSKSHPHSLGIMNLVGDGLHNLTDGIIIAAAYLTNFSLGLVTTIAVLLHEIPQELGDFSVLIFAGFSRSKALFFNLLSAFTAILGALLALTIGQQSQSFVQKVIPITAGGFIYIASSDLMPELKKEEGLKKSIVQLASLLLGIVIMWLFKKYSE